MCIMLVIRPTFSIKYYTELQLFNQSKWRWRKLTTQNAAMLRYSVFFQLTQERKKKCF